MGLAHVVGAAAQWYPGGMSPALRWTALVPATATAFVAAGVVGSVLGSVLGVWGEPLIGALAAGVFGV